MIYLDHAATSYPKPMTVISEIKRCMEEYCANPGRGSHSMALKTSESIFNARTIVASFFGIHNPTRLIFTKNATEALNIAILGVLKEGDHVITSCMEHNSVIRPLMHLKREGIIEVTIVEVEKSGRIQVERIEEAIQNNTKLVVATLSSNVNGIVMPYEEIGKLCRMKHLLFLLDASQGAGVIPIDVEASCIDMMAFPGHKSLLGPQGTGGLYIKDTIEIKPVIVGGNGSYSESIYQEGGLPDYLESGTLNSPGIIGLAEGIKFLQGIGIQTIWEKKKQLVNFMIQELKMIKGVTLYSPNGDLNTGIVSLSVAGMDSTEVSFFLDQMYDIKTRPGLHCAALAHTFFKTTETGLVRCSMGWNTSMEEIKIAIDAFRKLINKVNDLRN